MTKRSGRTWLVSAAMVAASFLVAGAPSLRAQNQVCCPQLSNASCGLPGCNTNGCQVGSYGESGHLYNVTQGTCCNNPVSVFTETPNTCTLGGEPAHAQLSVRVWILTCKGRYALMTLAVAA